ncbi:MAG: NAD(P)H-dependent oxidoreductase subunit E [Gammaproteobacteria bacterium]|nr:NAD(P)H-dependent oxidoreductase subunit E [Gammaproteobacteria bacterium]
MVEREIRSVAGRHVGRVGGVLQALREVVLEQGFVSEDDQRVVADVFNISRADVRGIVSFYEDLKTHPPAALRVRICQAEACQAVGGRRFTRAVEERLGIPLGEQNEQASIEAVYCLGLCAQGPAFTVNERPFTHADELDLDSALDLLGEAGSP